MTIAAFTQKRQNQTRRRATTSSSRSWGLSRPKRLGRGIALWKARSATPRKQTTKRNAASTDQYQAQPCVWLNQTTSAGAVRTATTVAARVSFRHWPASSEESSLSRNPPIRCASDATCEGCDAGSREFVGNRLGRVGGDDQSSAEHERRPDRARALSRR